MLVHKEMSGIRMNLHLPAWGLYCYLHRTRGKSIGVVNPQKYIPFKDDNGDMRYF